jgi:O-antigen/teichoic acid export membrane protein
VGDPTLRERTSVRSVRVERPGTDERRDRNLTQKASLTAAASSLDYVAGIGTAFVLNPLLVDGLGRYVYGVWRILWGLSGYLWATSGRSAQALTWAVARDQHSRDVEDKKELVGSALFVWLVFLPILAVAGGVGGWLLPLILHSPPSDVWPVRIAAWIVTVDAIALSLLTIPRSVLQGENLGYKRMVLSALLICVGGALMALAIHLGLGIVGVAGAQLADTVLTGLLFWRVAKRFVPWFGFARPARSTAKWFLGISWWFMGWKLVYEFLTASDVVVLGFFGAVELVTVYTLTKFVALAMVPLLSILLQGGAPGLGGIIGKGEMHKAIKVRREVMVFTWLIVSALGAAVLLWNRSFVDLWVGPDFYAGTVPNLLIVVMITQFIFLGNDARIIDLSLDLRAKVLIGAVSAALSFALAAVLVGVFHAGIVGMTLGAIVGRSVISVAYPVIVGRFLGDPFVSQLRGSARPFLVSAVLFALTAQLGREIRAGSWVELIVMGSGSAVVFALIASLAGLTRAQRQGFVRRARRVVRGSKTAPILEDAGSVGEDGPGG